MEVGYNCRQVGGEIMSAVSSFNDGLKGRIMNFLGAGLPAERVASVVGCEPSYISQLLAQEDFANAVMERRLVALQSATERDARLDSLEDTLITRSEKLIESPLAFTKPMEAIRALQVVNSLKRRGSVDMADSPMNQTVVNLILPTITVNKFTAKLDSHNQVVQAGEQTLVTIGNGSLNELAESTLKSISQEFEPFPELPSPPLKEIQYEQPDPNPQTRTSQTRASKKAALS